MKNINILKIPVYSLIFLSIIAVFSFFEPAVNADVKAQENRLTLGFDNSLRGNIENNNPQPITDIVVVPITTLDKGLMANPSGWINLIYYYSITRFKLPDIPFNYIIDQNGKIYDFTKLSESDNNSYYSITTGDNKTVISIGVLITDNEISRSSRLSLVDLVGKLSYEWGISFENTYPAKLSYQTTDTISKIYFYQSSAGLSKDINSVLADVNYSNEAHLVYSLKVSNITYASNMNGGDFQTVSLKLENISSYPIFLDKQYLYLVSSSSKSSVFVVNGEWDSFTRPLHVEEDVIPANGSITIEFPIKAPLIPGEYSDVFSFKWENGDEVENTKFTIKINVEKNNYELIKIEDTETGYLNVRKCPSINCEKLGEVASGTVLKLEDYQDNWYKIEYQEDYFGWIYGKYVSKL